MKQLINQRAIKRCKTMFTVFLTLIVLTYIADAGLSPVLKEAYADQDEVDLEKQMPNIQLQSAFDERLARLLKQNISAEPATKRALATKTTKQLVSFDGLPTQNSDKTYTWQDKSFTKFKRQKMPQGFVDEYYSGKAQCVSWWITIPGVNLLPKGMQGAFYIIFLGWLFMGIAIVADIFMEAIEQITSQTRIVEKWDPECKQKFPVEEPVWNATIANLSLMALGSSMPEIFLAVLETLQGLGEPAGELGPSTIVGSAAFNLLVISGLSIYAVNGGYDDKGQEIVEVKAIDDVGVFAITSTFSCLAYIWLFICLAGRSYGYITLDEAWITFLLFWVLLVLAWTADRCRAAKKSQIQSEEQARTDEVKIKRSKLRQHAIDFGSNDVLIHVATGQNTEQTRKFRDEVKDEIIQLYKEILDVNDISKVSLDQLYQVLEPESLFERFAARKKAGLGTTKDFLEVKGTKGQTGTRDVSKIHSENPSIGFKCMHYAVVESSGHVDVTIIKKNITQEVTFGIRTIEGTCKPDVGYEHIDEIVTIKKRQEEIIVQIPIIDNHDWQPDLDFAVELYDPQPPGKPRLAGDDTFTTITVLDEDFPGNLGFENTEITATRNQGKIEIVLLRTEGTDGKVSCMIKTEPFYVVNTDVDDFGNKDDELAMMAKQNAVEFEDYLPRHERVEFDNGESEQIINIMLVNENKTEKKTKKAEEEEDSEEELSKEIRFKVRIESPDPENVKISKKNLCIVSVLPESMENEVNKQQKMVDYFMETRNPSWGSQFKNAIMLSPKIDDDNLIIDDVTCYEALCHFCTITWKVLYAVIPPVKWGHGYYAFFVAMSLIGFTTLIVGEAATMLGCVLDIEPAVTAITFVAMGTSLPDTFASMKAARDSESADAAIGNVTGSNAVNVFLGLGLPWVIAAHYEASIAGSSKTGGLYKSPPGTLGFSVVLFLITSITCFILFILRRNFIGGELGGPACSRIGSCIFLIFLWLMYVIFSTMQAYKIINVVIIPAPKGYSAS